MVSFHSYRNEEQKPVKKFALISEDERNLAEEKLLATFSILKCLAGFQI